MLNQKQQLGARSIHRDAADKKRIIAEPFELQNACAIEISTADFLYKAALCHVPLQHGKHRLCLVSWCIGQRRSKRSKSCFRPRWMSVENYGLQTCMQRFFQEILADLGSKVKRAAVTKQEQEDSLN